MKNCNVCWIAALGGFAIAFVGLAVMVHGWPTSAVGAAWVQAVGSIVAIVGSYKVGSKQSADAHRSALELDDTRIRRQENGYRSVVHQVLEECLAATVLIGEKATVSEFAEEWNRIRSHAVTASLRAFDSMPIHDMGSFDRIEVAFRARELGAEISFLGNWASEAAGVAQGVSRYQQLKKRVREFGDKTVALTRELNALYEGPPERAL